MKETTAKKATTTKAKVVKKEPMISAEAIDRLIKQSKLVALIVAVHIVLVHTPIEGYVHSLIGSLLDMS